MQARFFRMEPAPDSRWMTLEALVDADEAASGFRLRLSAAHGQIHAERWAGGLRSDDSNEGGLDVESGLLWLRAHPSPVEVALVVELVGVGVFGATASLAEFEQVVELAEVAADGAPFERGFSAVEELPWADRSTDPNDAFEVAARAFGAPPSSASVDAQAIPGELPRPASDEWDLRNGRLAWWEPLTARPDATELQVVWLDLDGHSGQARVLAPAFDQLRLLPNGDILGGLGRNAFVVDTVAGESRSIEVNVKAGRRLSAHRSKMKGKRKLQGLKP